jgi:hypothetical protein
MGKYLLNIYDIIHFYNLCISMKYYEAKFYPK